MTYSVDNIVRVTTYHIPGGLSAANFGFACLFAPESESPAGINAGTYRDYTSSSGLLDEQWLSTSETYIAANKWLGSSPSTRQLRVYVKPTADSSYVDTLAAARNDFWWFITLATVDLYNNNADVLLVAEWCNSNEIYFPAPTNETTAITPGDQTSRPYNLSAAGYRYCHSTYHPTDRYAAFPILSWFATVNYSAQNSTITGEYKTISNVTPVSLTQTEYGALESNDTNCGFVTDIELKGSAVNNRYVNSITHSAYGEYIDSVFNTAAFVNAVKVEIFNLISGQPAKLGQTIAGQSAVISTAEAVCERYLQNGFLGERIYTNPDSGLEEWTPGYNILTKPEDILELTTTERSERLSAPLVIRVFPAGAIHRVFVDLTIY